MALVVLVVAGGWAFVARSERRLEERHFCDYVRVRLEEQGVGLATLDMEHDIQTRSDLREGHVAQYFLDIYRMSRPAVRVLRTDGTVRAEVTFHWLWGGRHIVRARRL